MLRSIGKQSGESMESVLKKKRTATEAKICRKRLYMRMGVVKLQYSESYSQEFNKLFSGPKSTYFQNIKSIHNFLKETNGCGRG